MNGLDSATVAEITQTIRRALAEDVGDGDVTTLCTIPGDAIWSGRLLAKAPGVVAGLDIAAQVFQAVDPAVAFTSLVQDGDPVQPMQDLATVTGPAQALLVAERTALNFLQRMSGIASLTRRYVDAVQGSRAVILDTRKTAPGLRTLDKLAVKLGGGQNHRIGLFDMVLIKNNHIDAAGGIAAAVSAVRAGDARSRPIEVEVRNFAELSQTLPLKVDRIMLDNMSPEQMAEAVKITAGRIPLEASGNVSLQSVAQIAATGVDYISVGKLTHSVQALDISFWLTTQVV